MVIAVGKSGTRLVHETCQRLVVDDRRDAQPRVFDEVPLELIQHRDQPGRIGRQQRARGDLADPVGEVRVELLLVEAGRTEQLEREDARQLRDLLVERHPAQEIVDALVDRTGRVRYAGSLTFPCPGVPRRPPR